MKTVYIINSLEGGGAERVFVELIKQVLVNESQTEAPQIILLDQLNEVYELPDEVIVSRLGNRGGLFGSLIQCVELHTLLKKIRPDFTVSFLTRANIMSVIIAKLRGWQAVISERSNTTKRLNNRFVWLKKCVVGYCYRRADLVIAVSQGVSDCLIDEFKISSTKVGVLHNPVDIEWLNERANSVDIKPQSRSSDKAIVAMGRLVKSKGFEDLIRAYKLSELRCGLTILGDGPERDRLKLLVTELALDEQVEFLGFVKNPHQIIKRAQVFVLCSHLEGFPNALLEAMALSKPVVATNCADGPSEILSYTGQVKSGDFVSTDYGLLVNVGDQKGLAKAMVSLHQNQTLRARLATNGRDRVTQFSKERFYLKYSKLITHLTIKKQNHV